MADTSKAVAAALQRYNQNKLAHLMDTPLGRQQVLISSTIASLKEKRAAEVQNKTASAQVPTGVRLLTKIASHDAGSLRVLAACTMMSKQAGVAESWDKLKNSLSSGVKDLGSKIKGGLDAAAGWILDPTHLKQLAAGIGTGGAAYVLSWLFPGAKQTHGLRLLASILAGIGAGYYGDNIFNAAMGKGFKSDKELAAAVEPPATVIPKPKSNQEKVQEMISKINGPRTLDEALAIPKTAPLAVK